MESLELFEVGWANDIAELFVTRRPRLHGNVYHLKLGDMTRIYFPQPCRSHEEQDSDAIKWAAYLASHEFEARKAFNLFD